MKSKILITMLISCLLIAPLVAGGNPIWAENRHDSQRTGTVEGIGNMKDGNIIQKWSLGPVSGTYRSFVADVNGDGKNDVVLSGGRGIEVIDGSTGNVTWTFTDDSKPYLTGLVNLGDRYGILAGGYSVPYMMVEYGKEYPVWNRSLANGPYSENYGFQLAGISYSSGNPYGIVVRPGAYYGYPNYPPVSGSVGNSSMAIFDLTDGNLLWSMDLPLFTLHAVTGDIDGDGSDDIVTIGIGTGGDYGVLAAYSRDGTEKWNRTGHFNGERLFIGDITGNGNPEIILANYTGYTCFDNRGDLLWNTNLQWSPETKDYRQNTDTTTIYPGKGILVMDGTSYLYFIDGSGSILWKKQMGEGAYLYPIVADMDGDGNRDIMLEQYVVNSYVRFICLNSDATEKWNSTVSTGENVTPLYMLVADVDSDGKLEVLTTWSAHGGNIALTCFEENSAETERPTPSFTAHMLGVALLLTTSLVFIRKKRS